MRCPVCGERTQVVDSHLRAEGRMVRRRRECSRCGRRFSTDEKLTGPVSEAVVFGAEEGKMGKGLPPVMGGTATNRR